MSIARTGKCVTLSRRRHKVNTPEFFATHPVFSLDQASRVLTPNSGRKGAIQRLKHHLSVGRLTLVTRGVYAVVPPGADAKRFEPDAFLVAGALRPDAVFSHHSAFELLGTAYSAWTVCTAYTVGRPGRFAVGRSSISFRRHPAPLADDSRLGTRRVERGGRLLVTTGPERTFVESLRQPALAGGLGELLESARAIPTLDLDLLQQVLRRYDLAILWAAAGWFLETHRDAFHVNEQVLRRLESRRPKSPQYLARSVRGGLLSRRWNLIVPDALTCQGEPRHHLKRSPRRRPA
jgi:predicted transcriptional regulator of viral defense system